MPNKRITKDSLGRKSKARPTGESDTSLRRVRSSPGPESDLQTAQRELATKEAQLRLALDHMPGGMKYVDGNQRYVLFNQQYSDLHGYPAGLLKVGGSIINEARFQAERGDYGDGDLEKLIEESLIPYRSAKPESYVRTLPTGRTLQFYVAPVSGGGFVSIVADITKQKQAEQAMQAAKERAEQAREEVAEKNRMLESLSNQLSKYLPPQVYRSIFSGKQKVEIASRRKKLTIFFSDIADFTGTTESMESEDLTNLLNRYMTEMSKIALDHGATIDKFVGDAIIAFFGDPETRGVREDAKACIDMAIAMQKRMQTLQSEWLEMGLERPFSIRIGINTGYCTVGNFGSEDRIDYTIIGNEVNLAARLEAHADPGGILIAHETYSLVKDSVRAEEGALLTVKGFSRPVRTYRVVGSYDELEAKEQIIREECEGVHVLIELDKSSKAKAREMLSDLVSRLED